MAWTALRFTVAGSAAEGWADALLDAGAVAVEFTDAAAGATDEVPQFGEPDEFVPGVWALNILSALFDDTVDTPAIVAAIAAKENWRAPVAYTLTHVEEQDWVRVTQSQFEPIRISPRLWILPSWHVAPDPAAINLIIDPGLAFGTGSHPTTRLCLQWLEAHLTGGERVLDYGCGSGILAIASIRLGASAAIGTDLDVQALIASRANAALNKVSCEFIPPDAMRDCAHDILVANILTNPLKVLAPALAKRVRPDGRIVLSGILVDQAAAVITAYLPWFNIEVWRTDENWAALSGIRR